MNKENNWCYYSGMPSPAAYQTDTLVVNDMIHIWMNALGLSEWIIATEAIDEKAVVYEESVPESDQYFVGIQIDRVKKKACIYHDRLLNEEDILHELLHVKNPDWSEDQVNAETEKLLKEEDG